MDGKFSQAAKRVRSGYATASVNSLRELEREQAKEDLQSYTEKALDDVELVFQTESVLAKLVEGGKGMAQKYCKERGFSETDTATLLKAAFDKLKEISDRDNETNVAIAKARYESLYTKNKDTDPRTALRAQFLLDKLNGVAGADANDLVKQMGEVISEMSSTPISNRKADTDTDTDDETDLPDRP